jgi:hypothetical protein
MKPYLIFFGYLVAISISGCCAGLYLPSFQCAEGLYRAFVYAMAIGLLPLFLLIMEDRAGLGVVAITAGCALSVIMLEIGVSLVHA